MPLTHIDMMTNPFKCRLYDSPFVKSRSKIYRYCLNNSSYSDTWKKSNICSLHENNDKHIINKYRPVSLILTCKEYLKNSSRV